MELEKKIDTTTKMIYETKVALGLESNSNHRSQPISLAESRVNNEVISPEVTETLLVCKLSCRPGDL